MHNSDINSTGMEYANIPSNYSRIIARELALQEPDLPKLLKFTGLSAKQLMQDDTLLTAKQLVQVLHNALQLSEYPDFGLRLGQRLTPATHGAVGFLANSSPNLLSALEVLEAFLPTRISFAHAHTRIKENTLTCYVTFDIALPPAIHRVLSEMFAVACYACAEFILGRPVTEARILFNHDEPPYSATYSKFLYGSYVFSHNELAVEIPLDTCLIPNASANHDSYILAKQQCEKILAQLQTQKTSTTYQVQKIMLSNPSSTVSEDEVAAALFISKRTLNRRLQKEQESFRSIRDSILAQQASDYLIHSDLSIDAIAALLNYHDSANFRRAFKRWFNQSPSEYRQQRSIE